MDTEKTWICPRCGTVNPDEYEVCYHCGNIVPREVWEAAAKKQEPPQPEPEQAVRAAPPQKAGRQGTAAGKRKGKKAVLVAACAAAVLLAAVFAIGEAAHIRANAFAAEDDYASAIEAAALDFFHSDFKEEQLVKRGRDLVWDGEFDSAIACLEQFPENEEAIKYLDEAIRGRDFQRLSKAREIIKGQEENRYREAEEILDSITHPDVDPTEYLNWAYIGEARDCLNDRGGSLGDARQLLEKVTERPDIEQALEVLDLMEQGEYIHAARLAAELQNNARYVDDGFTRSQWERIVVDRADAKASTPEEFLQYIGARNAFAAATDFTPESGSVPIASVSNLSAEYVSFGFTVTAGELARCGSSRDGKILIIWEIQNYDAKTTEYMIDGVAMNALPVERFPEKLEDVGIIVCIGVRGEKEGWYNKTQGNEIIGTIDAVCEKGSVSARYGMSGSTIYSSGPYGGPACPNSISWSNNSTVFGGLPTEELCAAVYSAIRRGLNS